MSVDSPNGEPLQDMSSAAQPRKGDWSDESTTLSSVNSASPGTQRRRYGADEETMNHGSNNTDGPISFEDSFRRRESQPIGFDRSFGLTCIVLHETLHSAAFYVLIPSVLCMRDGGPLQYTDNQAIVIILVFTGVAFFLPIFGGIIGDIFLGRYKAILYGTVIEFFGMVIILISSVLSLASLEGIGPEVSVGVAKFLFVTALLLIALGMGFIKANVTTFGAGQLHDTTDCAQKIQSYYRWYIFSINFGKLLAFCPISMFLLNYDPGVSSANASTITTISPNMSWNTTAEPADDTRHNALLAVGGAIVQVSFVGTAIFIFMMGKAKYKMIEPSGGHHMYYIFCFHRTNIGIQSLYDPHYQEYHQELKVYKRAVFRLTILMAALFAMYTMYEAVSFQMVSIFMLQFKELSQPSGLTVHLPLTFMLTFSTAVLILCVPFLECFLSRRISPDDVTEAEIDAVVAKWAEENASGTTTTSTAQHQTSISKLFGARRKRFASLSNRFNVDELDADVRQRIADDIVVRKHRHDILIRMGIGLGLSAVCILLAGILESVRKNYVGLGIENQPSVFWQVPQYLVMGAGEMIGGISAFEFASIESLPGLQGFTIGMFISTYGLGSLFALFCYALAAGSLMDPKDLNDINMENAYFGHFGLLIFIGLAFVVLARQYHIEHPCRLEEPKRPHDTDDDDKF